jgi:hypothetical protein
LDLSIARLFPCQSSRCFFFGIANKHPFAVFTWWAKDAEQFNAPVESLQHLIILNPLHSDLLETSILGLKVGNADVHGIFPFVKLVFVVHNPHPDKL